MTLAQLLVMRVFLRTEILLALASSTNRHVSAFKAEAAFIDLANALGIEVEFVADPPTL